MVTALLTERSEHMAIDFVVGDGALVEWVVAYARHLGEDGLTEVISHRAPFFSESTMCCHMARRFCGTK